MPRVLSVLSLPPISLLTILPGVLSQCCRSTVTEAARRGGWDGMWTHAQSTVSTVAPSCFPPDSTARSTVTVLSEYCHRGGAAWRVGRAVDPCPEYCQYCRSLLFPS